MNKSYRAYLPLLILLVCLTPGCRQQHAGWEPPFEETSARPIQNQVVEALRLVREAREEASRHPEQVADKLDGAERALTRMSTYYLPLLEARERTYNAHRLLYYGERQKATIEIEAVEKILDSVAAAGGSELAPAMKKPLDLVSEAKASVMAASDSAPDLIRSLAIELNNMVLKGGLELPND